MQKTQKKAILPATLAALLGNSIFGFSFMFSRMALENASPYVMLMYRFCLAFLCINGVALWARAKKKEGWMRFQIPWKKSAPLFVLGLVQPVCYFLCESWGISLTNATVSGVIIALIPIAALAGGAVFLKERPGWKRLCFSLLCILGVIVMTLQQSASGDVKALGIVLLVGAVVSGAAYNMMSRGISKQFSALERTYVMMLTGAIVFSVLAAAENRENFSLLLAPLQNGTFMLSMVYLSLFSSILAFLCLNFAATVLPVSKTTAFCNITTVLSVFAGAVFLGDAVTPVSVLAALVIIAGVFGVQKT